MPRAQMWIAILGAAAGSCDRCHGASRERDPQVDEGASDPEEADDQRDNYWRVRVVIVGAGDASTADKRIACHGAPPAAQSGACGPVLLRFNERAPPLVRATPAPSWHFARWSSLLTEPDGSTHPRTGKMPDGVLYLNGFGYADTGELETVTAVFVPDASP
jgi:hypothetical protein